MRRREFMALAGSSAASWPLASRAQQADHVRRVGVLVQFAENDPEAQLHLSPFVEELESLGWADGRNLRIDYRFWAGDPDRMRLLSAELAGLGPDVILVSGAPGTAALQRATRTIPIVFTQIADPVGSGLVTNLGRPSGNVTGFTHFQYGIVGKWLQVLIDMVPHVIRVLMIQNPENFAWPGYVRSAEGVATSFGARLTAIGVRDSTEIESTIGSFAREPDGGMIVLPDTTTSVHRQAIVSLAARYGLPAIYPFRYFITAGGLMCYGVDVSDVSRRSATYVDRILRGGKPSDLPIQAATKFELVINLRTANTLGLTIPPNLLARADEVIE